MKATPLLLTPEILTTTFPVVAPEGTVVAMEVELQLVTVAAIPLNDTVLVPWVDPKLVPVIVTDEFPVPALTDSPVMLGIPSTVNGTSLLPTLFTQTLALTLPTGAPEGTAATIEVAVQLVIGETIP